MQLRFFRVPAVGGPELEADLNRFLRSVRPLTVDRQFVAAGAHSFWSLCVEYLASPKVRAEQAGRERVDYKAELTPEAFAVFARLREARKAIAAEEGGWMPPLRSKARSRPARSAEGPGNGQSDEGLVPVGNVPRRVPETFPSALDSHQTVRRYLRGDFAGEVVHNRRNGERLFCSNQLGQPSGYRGALIA